jgi:hypothetical protein
MTTSKAAFARVRYVSRAVLDSRSADELAKWYDGLVSENMADWSRLKDFPAGSPMAHRIVKIMYERKQRICLIAEILKAKLNIDHGYPA